MEQQSIQQMLTKRAWKKWQRVPAIKAPGWVLRAILDQFIINGRRA